MNGLSAADVAFMRHLSADLVPDDRPGKRRRVETLPATVAATYDNSRKNSAAMDANVNGTPARSPQGVGAKKGPPHRKGARGPNPLAVKKKRVREVFRVGTGAQAKPKQGTK
ncbi:hypothetical protein DQ04_08201010 [Trypanosoma grayi]|uniref:hypothetical protein n=1 Tax=Trypanosoma grayi TaxID=71804 RepID=UPI0004F44EC1|nr:hypothetical protein DQ04_08201010 [Trypanosoma grayi]KEG08021.1 hypothetical protein DQ04_08201010 [Trypanosoma grayi]